MKSRVSTFQTMKHALTVPAAKYKLYRALTKTSSATTDSSASTAASQSGQQTRHRSSQATHSNSTLTESLPKHSSLRSLPKSRPVESPTKPTTSNPFSPVRQSRRIERITQSREVTPDDSDNVLIGRSSEADSNPFVVSPSKESTIQISSIFSAHRDHSIRRPSERDAKDILSPSSSFLSRKVSPSDTFLSHGISPSRTEPGDLPTQSTSRYSKRTYDFALSPRKLQDLLAVSSMANGTATNQTYTPRTKARKRMRGEDIPYTPSEGRRKRRWRESPEHHSDQAANIPLGSKNSPTRQHNEAQAENNGGIEELPESPVKPRYPPASIGSGSGFRPIFDGAPSITRASPSHTKRSSTHARASPSTSAPIPQNTKRRRAGSSSPPQFSKQSSDNIVITTAKDVVGPEYVLYPPSPHKQHSTSRSNPRIPNQAPDSSRNKMDEVGRSPSGEEDVVISHNLAWGVRPDWLAREGISDLDVDDDALGKTILPPRPPSPTPEIHPTADTDLEISDNLSQALTISAFDAGHNVPRGLREAAASYNFVQGREDLSLSRTGSGIWGVGEVDDDGEDWESEPDGWNASPDL
jgi:hypothetical protein